MPLVFSLLKSDVSLKWRRGLMGIISVVGMTGCGQTGALYLPKPTLTTQSSSSHALSRSVHTSMLSHVTTTP